MKYEKTALRIREAMQDMGMSQQDLADKSHIGKSSISHYVNGTHQPQNKSAYQIAKALDVNPAWIMGLDAKKQIDNVDLSFDFANSLDESDNTHEFIQKFSKLSIENQNAVKKYIDFLSDQGGM